jgi:hypothetical protein
VTKSKYKKNSKIFLRIINPKYRTVFGTFLRTIGFFIFFAGDSDRSKKELNDVLDEHILHRYFAYLLILIFIGLFLSVAYFSFVKHSIFESPTTYSISAITEQVHVTTQDTPMSRWHVKDIEISKTCPDEPEDIILMSFTGSININPFVQLTLTRLATGDLSVEMYTDNESVGDLFDKEDEYDSPLSNCTFFYIRNISDRANRGKTIVLPLTGNIVAGKEIRFLTQSTTPLLKSGNVTILDRAFWTGENYSVGPFDLETGDLLDIKKTKEPVIPSQGFALINDEPAINLVFRATGYRAVIKRFQAENYELRNSFWSKLYRDEGLLITWGVIIFLFSIIRIYLRYLVN